MLPVGLRSRRPTVLAFIDLVQDVDVMAPVLVALKADGRFGIRICVSRWLERESPRTGALLDELGFRFSYVRRRDVIEGRTPSLRGLDAVISASESTHEAHLAAYALARRAKTAGLRTYALQHGFENAGLFGVEAEAVRFASQTIFCWFPAGAAPADLPDETRAKLVHVGRPSPSPRPPAAEARTYDVGVFENLHWDRYSDADRHAFRSGLLAMARALPHIRILLRPHPAGGWSDHALGHELAQMRNISRLGAAEARHRPDSGAQVLEGLGRVITTPSTVALDAAQAGKPVCLAVFGGAPYAPLPVLDSPQAWTAFASGEQYDRMTLDQFLARVLVPGDGAGRILERLSRDLEERKSQSHE